MKGWIDGCSFGANSSILVVVSYLFLYIKFNLTLMKNFSLANKDDIGHIIVW